MSLDLIASALAVRERAYAPYSGYQVGAAILGSDGAVYVGTNVENVSYGLTICAERAALCAMIAAGCRTIRAIAVVTEDGGAPCGACRQILNEFSAADVPVYCSNLQGQVMEHRMGDLLPFAFSSDAVDRDGQDA